MAVHQQIPEARVVGQFVLLRASEVGLRAHAELEHTEAEHRLDGERKQLTLAWRIAGAGRLFAGHRAHEADRLGKIELGFVGDRQVEIDDLVIEVRQLDGHLHQAFEQRVLAERHAQRPHREALRRHVRVEIEHRRRLAGDAALADEPLLDVDDRRQLVHQRVQVEHLAAAEIHALPVRFEVERLGIDPLGKRLQVRQAQHQVARLNYDAGRPDLTVRQVEIARRFEPHAGLGIERDRGAEIELHRFHGGIGLEPLGQVQRVLGTHRLELVLVEPQADIHRRQQQFVGAGPALEEEIERLGGRATLDIAGRRSEVELERQRREFEPGLPDHQRYAVHERQADRQLPPQRQRADDGQLVFVLEQVEFSDAEELADPAEHADVARRDEVVRPIRQEVDGRDEVRSGRHGGTRTSDRVARTLFARARRRQARAHKRRGPAV